MLEEEREYTKTLLDDAGLVCTITKEEEENRLPNAEYLRKNVIGLHQIKTGYVADFGYNSKIAHSILEFVIKEHKCCPFFQFEIGFNREDDKIQFRIITENSENKDQLEEIFRTIFDK